ncbi:unnamed protein product [[Candida] boidinii]|uniref:Unnamed protein product n=1 Tax=Candida boidinii TaxID=5477 RepID=A0ACB5TU97_CANBO|nr:unnamed protein product [[Candida] boidinii]
MRITSKEKQQMSLPPLPPTSKQQIQQHQRAISAYTAAEFQQEQNNKPSRMTSMRNPDRQQQQVPLPQPSQQTSSESRNYHPSARANSLGHSRKHSLNMLKQQYTMTNAPPVPSIPGYNDDGFFDEIDMDEIGYNAPVKPVKRLSDNEIIAQYDRAAPGTMPSIEYPKTLFLKGFFSVQTTSTKPLPIIRYDIMYVLPQLGVKFTEVKGGFVCIHYPSVISTAVGNDVNAAVPVISSSEPHKAIENVSSAVPTTLTISNSDESVKIHEIRDDESEKTAVTTPNLDRARTNRSVSSQKRSEPSSSNSSSYEKSKNDEPVNEEERSVGSGSGSGANSALSSPLRPNGHRRKFSLGNGLLGGYRKQKEKLTLSTNVPSNDMPTLNIPTTPAPANLHRHTNSITYDSTDSMNSFHDVVGSDMLISSRLEQQNRIKSPLASNSPKFGTTPEALPQQAPSRQQQQAQEESQEHSRSSSNKPLKFEIHIVKVPLVGIYGVQFKKIRGNTWSYKSLASEILNRLNL